MRPFIRMEGHGKTMISLLRRCAAGLLAALGFALPASATTYSTDFTDLWYNPAESGWGVNLIQQSDTIFATLFVYGQDGSAHWFVASALKGSGGTFFSGTLFETTGPAFSVFFNPAAVNTTPVGNMTLSFNSVSTGTLSYTVNGIPVSKQIQRQTWTGENLSGNYLGGLTANGSSCGNGATNGPVLIFDTLTVTHTGGQVTARVNFFNSSGTASVCTFSGAYGQTGRLGNVTGSFSCTFGTTPGNQGTFTISQIDAGVNGFNGNFQGSDQFCNYNGFFGGVRDVL
jgi:hypothetical protein